MKPLVSVVIPTYNRAHIIVKAIQSVQLQSYVEWEAIVVDDGSDDATSEIVGRMAEKDSRIRLILQPVNRGAQAARNVGIKLAKGEWVTFLDSDDEWLPDSLKKRLEKAVTDGVAVVHSGGYIRRHGKELEPYRIVQPSGKVYPALLARENPMFQALMVSKYALEKIGYLDEAVVSFQEWDTSIRLARFYLFASVAEPTFVYDYRMQDAISRDDFRAAVGYSYIVRKHLFFILAYVGPRALLNHYYFIAFWYERAGDHGRARISKLKGLLWLFLFPVQVFSLVARRTYEM